MELAMTHGTRWGVATRHGSALTVAIALGCALPGCSRDTPTGPGEEPARPELAAAAAEGPITLGGNLPSDINVNGVIVGSRVISAGTTRAFSWQSGMLTDLGTGGSNSQAEGISDAGHIVGMSDGLPFIWHNGAMTELARRGGGSCGWGGHAYAVNSSGVVVGQSDTLCSRSPVLWRNGKTTDLGSFSGNTIENGTAFGINDRGQVVGESNERAFLWQNGTMRDLGSLGGGSERSVAYDINERGQVVGVSYIKGHSFDQGFVRHAFLWSNGVMTDLGTLGSLGQTSFAYGINDSGQVVGTTESHAFVWHKGTMVDLGLGKALAINNAGEIVGEAYGSSITGARWTAPTVFGSWTARASLPSARRGSAIASASGLLYSIGGNNSAGAALTVVDAYDPGSNSWRNRAPLPAARQNGNGAASIGNKIYLAGGQDGSGTLTRTLYIYDTITDSWTTGADMPVAGGCGGSAAINGILYVFSGCRNASVGVQDFAQLLHRYNPNANRWTTLRLAPAVHFQPGVAAFRGKLYVAGGSDASGATRRLDVYDPATASWSTRAAMPTARVGSAAAFVGGRFHVFGGRNGTQFLKTVEAYDPATNSWGGIRASLPEARAGLGVGVIGELAYAAGGHNNTRVLAAHKRYAP
jgi:probable HAF family extracellular repeat protein